jgi:hypothetical protein
MCYYRSTKTTSGFYDVAWLKLNILGEKVTGEFNNLPAEKDSKVGIFEGTILPANSTINEKSATVWWDSRAEGMEVKEELSVKSSKDEKISIGINAQFLIDALKEVDSEYITCGITGQMSPVTMTPINDDNYISIIMPIQIKSSQND